MALPKFFVIRGFEIGGTQNGLLQYRDGSSWVNLGNWVTNATIIIIDSANNPIEVPYRQELYDVDGVTPLLNIDGEPLYNGGIFYSGGTWCFRLVDSQGHPISNVVCFTFPADTGPLQNLDGTPLLNVDGNTLFNA